MVSSPQTPANFTISCKTNFIFLIRRANQKYFINYFSTRKVILNTCLQLDDRAQKWPKFYRSTRPRKSYYFVNTSIFLSHSGIHLVALGFADLLAVGTGIFTSFYYAYRVYPKHSQASFKFEAICKGVLYLQYIGKLILTLVYIYSSFFCQNYIMEYNILNCKRV